LGSFGVFYFFGVMAWFPRQAGKAMHSAGTPNACAPLSAFSGCDGKAVIPAFYHSSGRVVSSSLPQSNELAATDNIFSTIDLIIWHQEPGFMTQQKNSRV